MVARLKLKGIDGGSLIAKQRNGPTGDVHLTFLKSYTRFESAAKISASTHVGPIDDRKLAPFTSA